MKIPIIIVMASLMLGAYSPAHAAEVKVPGLAKIKKVIGKSKKTITVKDNKSDNKEEGKDSPSEEKGPREKKVPQSMHSPKEIEKAAEFASEKTGVRKDFLMGMLTVESDLGRKTGECTYGEVASGAEEAHNEGRLSQRAWKTFQERRKTIEKLADDLGYDAKMLKVSCNPTNYAGTGGALGIPQFMPDIWMIYKDEIGGIVGKKNPDPWNPKDGVVAMALLLADTAGVTNHNYYAERNAAKMYLSGTTSERYGWYADQAFYWSRNYKRLIG